MKPFEFARARNVDAAVAAAGMGYSFKAGGIDMVDLLKERIESPGKLVSILGIDEMKQVSVSGGMLRIGALATLAEVASHPLVSEHAAALGQACRSAATPQIRAVATVAGNICQRPRCWYYRSAAHPCLKKGGSRCYAVDGENEYHAIFGSGPCYIVHPSSAATALVALEASIVARSGDEEITIPAREFFQSPDRNMFGENSLPEGALITAIHIPTGAAGSAYVEFKEKQSFDWPIASCAAVKRNGGWKLTMGSVAPVPWIPTQVEELLASGSGIDMALAERAADAAVADANPMSRNAWRVKIARAAVRRALLMADGKEID